MKSIHSTDYLAVVTKIEWVSPVTSMPTTAEVFHHRKETYFYLVDLVIAAAIVVATEMLNWSH
jgi:hypothetical protein